MKYAILILSNTISYLWAGIGHLLGNKWTKIMKLTRENCKKLIFPDMVHAVAPFLVLGSTADNATRMEVFAKLCTGDAESPFEYAQNNNHRKYLGIHPRKLEDEIAGDLKKALLNNKCCKIRDFLCGLSEEDHRSIYADIEKIEKTGKKFPNDFITLYCDKLIKTLEARESHLDDDEYELNNEKNGTILNDSITKSLNWSSNYNLDTIEGYINKELNDFIKLDYNNLSVVPDGTDFNSFFIDNQYSAKAEDTHRIKKKHIFDIFNKPRQNIENDFIKTSQNIMLVGSGGIDKSTYLRYLMLCILKNFNKYNLIPVYVQSKFYEKSCIESTLRGLNDIRKNNQQFIVLIDALDEANFYQKPELLEEVNNIITNIKNIRFIITSRSASIATYILKHFETRYLYRFTIDQVQSFITNVCKINNVTNYLEDSNFGFKKLAENNEDLIRTPLFLSLIIKIYQEFNYLPQSKVEIFEYIYNLMYKNYDESIKNIQDRLKSKLPSDSMKIMISAIAYHCGNEFTRNDLENKIPTIIDENPMLRYADTRDLLDDLTINIPYLRIYTTLSKNSLLNAIGNETYSFIYTTLYEYFVAYYLCVHQDKIVTEIKDSFLEMEGTTDDIQVLDFLVELLTSHDSNYDIEKHIILPSLAAIIQKWPNIKTFLSSNFYEIEYATKPEYKKYDNRPYKFLTDFIMQYYHIKAPEINKDKVSTEKPKAGKLPSTTKDGKINLESPTFVILYQYPLKTDHTYGLKPHTKRFLFYLEWLLNKKGTKYEKRLEVLWKLFTDKDSDFFKFYDFIIKKEQELKKKYNL